MELTELTIDSVISFTLLLTRLSAVIMSAPVFGSRNVPNQIKIAISLLLSMLFYPYMGNQTIEVGHSFELLLMILTELMIGIGIGLIANVIFASIQVAGQFIDMQMGFAIANVMDPQYQIQIPVVGHFKYILAVLIYLSINGHHVFIRAVYESYQIVPLGYLPALGEGGIAINTLFSSMFVLGVLVSAPALGTLFFTNIALGVLARTVPQMNVFIIGFPVKIFIGFLALILMLPYYEVILSNVFQHIWDGIYKFLEVL